MKIVLVSLMVLFALNANAVEKSCLTKVVNAVNKHHTLAEGSVYALRTVYEASFGAALLVGHSDETDPTDYLVTVDLTKNCQIKSIVYTEDASNVQEYTYAETQLVEQIYKEQTEALNKKALELIKLLPESGYDTRTLCIFGDKVVGQIPMTHWSAKNRKTAVGTVNKFPAKILNKEPKIEIYNPNKGLQLEGNEYAGFFAYRGGIGNTASDVCVAESKPVLE